MKPKIALALKDLTEDQIISTANQIVASMTANAALYGTSDPDAAEITTATTAAETALTAQAVAQQAAEAATTAKLIKFAALEALLTKGASWAEDNLTTAADIEKVYPLQKVRETTTTMAQATSLSSTYGDGAGEVDLAWDPVPKARSYAVQARELPAGTWAIVKAIGRSRATIEGLTPGGTYQFRVRAIGPNDLEGPWSDITERRAP